MHMIGSGFNSDTLLDQSVQQLGSKLGGPPVETESELGEVVSRMPMIYSLMFAQIMVTGDKCIPPFSPSL